MQKGSRLTYFGTAALERSWTLRFLESPHQAWDVFSTTHLMNRRVGMEVSCEQRQDPRESIAMTRLGGKEEVSSAFEDGFLGAARRAGRTLGTPGTGFKGLPPGTGELRLSLLSDL
jgi:hypothetical protein